MIRISVGLIVLTVVLLASTGCANLTVKKVSLNKRLEGKDHLVHGFRYYLSRPYLVVSNRILVSKTEQQARIVQLASQGPNGKIGLIRNNGVAQTVLESIDPSGRPVYYTMDGMQILQNVDPKWVMPIEMTVSSAQPGTTEKQKSSIKPEDNPSMQQTNFQTVGGNIELNQPHILPLTSGEEGTGGIEESVKKNVTLIRFRPPEGEAISRSNDVSTCLDHMKVVYLPDFEEQMAICDINIAAKSGYELQFRDGWQLRSVKGEFDSTEIPIKFLNTIKGAISAATELEKTRIEGKAKSDDGRTATVNPSTRIQAVILRTNYIEPGIYKLLKESERQNPTACGIGILEDLGVPVIQETSVRILVRGVENDS